MLLSVVLAAAPVAHAQPDQAAVKAAKEHYQRGLEHYNLGEFYKAIAAYKESYRLLRAPQLIFNMAQAYRQMGDLQEALHHYQTYLRESPNAANASDVEQFIAEIESSLAEKQKQEEAEAKARATPKTRTVIVNRDVERDAADNRGPMFRKVGLITAGAGIVVVGTGIVFGLSARAASSDISELSETGGMWSESAEDAQNRGKRSERLSVGLTIFGGAALATGAVLYFLGRSDAHNATVAITPNGASMAASWEF